MKIKPGTIKYGSTEKTKILDEHGSTVATETNYRAGVVNPPVRMRYNIKHQVNSPNEEHEAYRVFSQELASDKSMLDPSTKTEHTKYGDANGHYYLVTSYTRLEYDV